MGVLFQGRPTLTPFGVLSQALAQEILARAGQTEGVYPYVPLDLLEDTSEEDSRPAAPPTAAIQVELKLTLEALRAAERGQRALDEAARRVLERAVQLQVRPVPTALAPGAAKTVPADSGRAKPSAPAEAGRPAPRGRARGDKRPAAGQPAETAPVQTGVPQIAQSFYQRFYQTIHQHIRFFALLPGARAGGLTELSGAEALGSFAAPPPGGNAREGRPPEALTAAPALSGGGRGLSELGGLARRTEEFSRRLRQLREEGLAPAEREADAPWRGEGGELVFPEHGEGTAPTRTSARTPDVQAAAPETAWAARAEMGNPPAPVEQATAREARTPGGRGAAQPPRTSTDRPEGQEGRSSVPHFETPASQTSARRAGGERAPMERRQPSRPDQTGPADETPAQVATSPATSTGSTPAAPGPEGRATAEHAAPETERPAAESTPASETGRPAETGMAPAAQPAQGRPAPAGGAASQGPEGQGPTAPEATLPEAELAIPGVPAPAGYAAPGGELIFPTPADEAEQSPAPQGMPRAGKESRTESPRPTLTGKARTDKISASADQSKTGKSPTPAEQTTTGEVQAPAGRGAAQPSHASADRPEGQEGQPSVPHSETQTSQTSARRAGEESAPAARRQPSRPGQTGPADETPAQVTTSPATSMGSTPAAPGPEGRATAEYAAPETKRPAAESTPASETGHPAETGMAPAAQPAQSRPASAGGAASQGPKGQEPTAPEATLPEAELAIPGVPAPAGYAAPGGELIFPTPADEAGQSPAPQGMPRAGKESRTESPRPAPTGKTGTGKSPAPAEQSRTEAAQAPAGRGAAQPSHASADRPEGQGGRSSAPHFETQASQTSARRAGEESAPTERRQPSRPGQTGPADETPAQVTTSPATSTGSAPAVPVPEGRATAKHAAPETGRPAEKESVSAEGHPVETGAAPAAQSQSAQGRPAPAGGAASQGPEGQGPTAPEATLPEAELAIPGVPAPAGYAAPGGELIFPTPADEAGQSLTLQGTPLVGRESGADSPRPAPTGRIEADKTSAPQGTSPAGKESQADSHRSTPVGRAEGGKPPAPVEQSRREPPQAPTVQAGTRTDRPAVGKTNAGGESAPTPAGETARGRWSRETATAIPAPAAPAAERAAYGAVPGAELVFPTPGQDAPEGLRPISARHRDIRTAVGAIPTVGARLTGSTARTVGLQARRLETASGPAPFPAEEGASAQTVTGRPVGQPLSGTSPAERMAAQPQSVELTYGQAVQFPFPIQPGQPVTGTSPAQPSAWTPQAAAPSTLASTRPDQILPGEVVEEMPFPAGTPAQTAPLPGSQGTQVPFPQSVAERATALSVPGFPDGPSGGQGMIQWTAPSWQPPAVDTQFLEKVPVEHQMGVETPRTVRVSDAEIRRTADQVYRLLEDRLRRERRRLGL